ncbi:MAG: Hpt domain-containing protein [Phyllobacteriaceae bacterium]|nr:Hpt domain-containing protein [Phyllobacteriaceae bacterium]
MAVTAEQIAFANPSGEMMLPSRGRPVDLVHLARQSSGDKGLETEILNLFRQQLGLCMDQLRQTTGRERKILAHTIKGSAKAVGAFGLARVASQIEEAPQDDALVAMLGEEVVRIRDFISGLNR